MLAGRAGRPGRCSSWPAHSGTGRWPGSPGPAPDMVVFDVHSHTNVSHDVRGTLMRGFDAEANLAWHGRAGFDAFFITDHNTIEPG